tara:strand:- start:19223 stop:19666 length:444 start_codon:yes stop_codon:yes gene_type:complete
MLIQKIKTVRTPTRGTSKSAGLDFYVPEDFESRILGPNESINIPSGIKVRVPEGHMLCAFNKSGIALNHGLQVGACVVDEDYQGEVHLHVANIGDSTVEITRGMKLVQFILIPVVYVDVVLVPIADKDIHWDKTERGEGAFGSTNNI